MRITYNAKRSLVAGHTLGDEYTLVLGAQTINPRRRRNAKRVEALDDSSETDLYGINKMWFITTTELRGTEELEFLEFWESVAAGEFFQFDPYATTVEVSPRTCELIGDDLNPVRLGTSDMFSYPFRVREI